MMRNGTRVCKASMTLQMVPRVRRAREKTIRKQGDTGKALIVCISPFRLILSKEAEKPGKRETRKTKHRAPQLFPRAGLQWAREGAGGLLGWLGWLSWLTGTRSTPRRDTRDDITRIHRSLPQPCLHQVHGRNRPEDHVKGLDDPPSR